MAADTRPDFLFPRVLPGRAVKGCRLNIVGVYTDLVYTITFAPFPLSLFPPSLRPAIAQPIVRL